MRRFFETKLFFLSCFGQQRTYSEMDLAMCYEPDELDDLLKRAASGDRQALNRLFDLYRSRLKKMVRLRLNRRLQGRVDDSDILQDAYLEAARRLPGYLQAPRAPFFLWLRRITGDKLLEVHRTHLGTQMRDVGREISLHRGALPPANSASLAAQLFGRLTSPSQAAVKAEMRIQLQEARAAAKLHHTNIVPVFGVGKDDGLGYYVMQFIQGLALDQVINELKRIKADSDAPTATSDRGAFRVNRRDLSAADVAHALMSGTLQPLVAAAEDGSNNQRGADVTLEFPSEASLPAAAAKQASPIMGRLSDTFSISDSLPGLPNAGSASEHTAKQQTYWESVARIGMQVASALAYAHGQGDRWIPSETKRDLRNWEWYYLVALCHQDRLTVQHSGATCVDWSPVGKHFASGGRDKTVRFWDASGGYRWTGDLP
jgi:RNA polymerase sigma-70 factor, ECF subfamily